VPLLADVANSSSADRVHESRRLAEYVYVGGKVGLQHPVGTHMLCMDGASQNFPNPAKMHSCDPDSNTGEHC
jgi:hypothetical protein